MTLVTRFYNHGTLATVAGGARLNRFRTVPCTVLLPGYFRNETNLEDVSLVTGGVMLPPLDARLSAPDDGLTMSRIAIDPGASWSRVLSYDQKGTLYLH